MDHKQPVTFRSKQVICPMSHPYEVYENTEMWRTIEDAILALRSNGDIDVTTDTALVVGYLCNELTKAKVPAKS